MPHRVKNEHNSRHRTHAVKPANQYIGPLGQTVKPVSVPVLIEPTPEIADVVVAVEGAPTAV